MGPTRCGRCPHRLPILPAGWWERLQERSPGLLPAALSSMMDDCPPSVFSPRSPSACRTVHRPTKTSGLLPTASMPSPLPFPALRSVSCSAGRRAPRLLRRDPRHSQPWHCRKIGCPGGMSGSPSWAYMISAGREIGTSASVLKLVLGHRLPSLRFGSASRLPYSLCISAQLSAKRSWSSVQGCRVPADFLHPAPEHQALQPRTLLALASPLEVRSSEFPWPSAG